MDSIYSVIAKEWQARNLVYDGETAHGEHKAAQEQWQHDLLQELNLLYVDDDLNKTLSLSLSKPDLLKFGDPDHYEYRYVQLIFEDKFDDDRNGWLKERGDDSGVFAGINQGTLEINNTRPSGNCNYNIKADIDYNRNFELQFSFMIRKSVSKRESTGGFYWGVNTPLGFSWVSISRRAMEIINCHGGDHKSDKRQRMYIAPALKENKFYKIAIRKIGNRYFFFLNDLFKAELPFEILPGNELACSAKGGSFMIYDYIRIYYLD